MLLPLFWEFSGWKIEDGETPQADLKQEIEEEMHFTIKVGEQVEHTVHEYDFGIVLLTTFFAQTYVKA